jgi:uncharacterized protein with PIN domain
VIVLDAYALIALIAGEPAADEVARLIAGGPTTVAAPNLAEAADRLGRVHGITVQRTRSVVETLEQSADLHVRGVDARDAWRATELRVTHYHRTRRPLSLVDCLLLAVTGPDDQLATSDPHVLATASDEHVDWLDLPDSQGHRHPPSS